MQKDLSGGDGLAELGATLPGGEADGLALDGLGGLLDDLLAFGEDEFDVARVGHVRVDLGLLDVLYDEICIRLTRPWAR